VQKYPVRANHRANLQTEALVSLVRTHFDSGERHGEEVEASYGAISTLRVAAEGRDLRVDVSMNPKVPEDVARETIRRYNDFLEEVTGYSSKERARKLRQSATSSGSDGA